MLVTKETKAYDFAHSDYDRNSDGGANLTGLMYTV